MQVSNMNTLLRVLALCLGFASPACLAAIIGFESEDEQGITLDASDSIAAQSFLFTQLNESPATLFAGVTDGAYAGNGSSSSLFAGNAAQFRLTTVNGAVFSLGSLEIGGGNLGDISTWAAGLQLLGLTADNNTLSQFVAIDSSSFGLALVSLNWNNLARVDFSVVAGDYSIDNVDVESSDPV